MLSWPVSALSGQCTLFQYTRTNRIYGRCWQRSVKQRLHAPNGTGLKFLLRRSSSVSSPVILGRVNLDRIEITLQKRQKIQVGGRLSHLLRFWPDEILHGLMNFLWLQDIGSARDQRRYEQGLIARQCKASAADTTVAASTGQSCRVAKATPRKEEEAAARALADLASGGANVESSSRGKASVRGESRIVGGRYGRMGWAAAAAAADMAVALTARFRLTVADRSRAKRKEFISVIKTTKHGRRGRPKKAEDEINMQDDQSTRGSSSCSKSARYPELLPRGEG